MTRVVAPGLLVPRSPLFGGCLFGRFENGNAFDIDQCFVLYRASLPTRG